MLSVLRSLWAWLLFSSVALAEPLALRIAAASDLRFALQAVVADFDQRERRVEISFGSSGKLAAQIEQGAPFDVFFSADVALAQRLFDRGWSSDMPVAYAIGHLVLWRLAGSALQLQDLAAAGVRHVAIANPQHAPYGMRAVEALHAAGVWDQVESKLVYGENVAQAAQLVSSGAADAGLIAGSVLAGLPIAERGSATPIAASLHAPLRQAYVLRKGSADDADLQRLLRHLAAPASQQRLLEFGLQPIQPPS